MKGVKYEGRSEEDRRDGERGKWWVLFFIIMLSPKISSALDFEERGVISGKTVQVDGAVIGGASDPSIAVNPLNGEVCVGYRHCCESSYPLTYYGGIKVKCLRNGLWEDLGSIIKDGYYGDLYIDETGIYLAVWDNVTWWRGAIRVFKFEGNDWVQIGHLSKFSNSEYHPSFFSLTVHNGNPVVAYWGVVGYYKHLYVYMYENGVWKELRAENICSRLYPYSGGSCYGGFSPNRIGILSDGSNLYLMWNSLVEGHGDCLFVEKFDGFKWEILPDSTPAGIVLGGTISRKWVRTSRSGALFLTPDKSPGVLYVEDIYWPWSVYMDIWDGTKWVEIDDKINDEGIFSVEVSSPTKSVLFSPNGDVFAAFLQRYDNLRVVVKRYNPSNRVWVKEYESEPYLEANSPSLAQYDGYIYVAEGGKREEVVCVGSVCFPYRVSKIHIKRALLPFGRAQFEECFARVVSSKNGIEELMNRDCLVENMVFYNGFLYDVLKDPSRTLRERVFAGAYLFEFPQYLNEERISYLNSSEFVSLLREALFQYDGDYIQEKAMFSLVREENEYAGILISDILSSIEHPEFETMMRRHIAGESFIFIGNLLFNLLFEDSYSGGKVYGLFPFLGTSGIPFYRFIQLFYSSAPREKKLRGLRCLIDIFTHRKVDEIEEGTRNALIEAICEMSVDPLLRGESFLAISFLKGKCEGKDAIDLLGEGEYLPEILRGISEAGDVADISRLQEIATAEDMPLYTRLWAFWSLSDIALRNELGDVIIWVLENGYLFAREILLNENIPSFLRLEAFSFVSGITDPWGLSELAKEVIYSTQNLSFLSEVLPSIAQNTDCSLIPDAEFLHSAYSYELTQVSICL